MAKRKAQHGGYRPNSGRKPKPPDERRDQVFSIKVTMDEKRLLEQSDARSWARDELLKSARRRL
jgi:hypothetical protein